jgi:hypothetical protein
MSRSTHPRARGLVLLSVWMEPALKEYVRLYAAAVGKPLGEAAADLIRRGHANKSVEKLPRYRAWQCSGCRWVFDGEHQQRCPECQREGYWTGSVDPLGVRWPGYIDGRASCRLMTRGTP